MVTFLSEIDEADSDPVQSTPATVSEIARQEPPPAQNVFGDRSVDAIPAVTASPASSPVAGFSNYWETVRAAVARNVRYPSVAIRKGIEGTIALRLTVDAQGNLVEAVPLEGSSDILIQSALSAARRAAPFPTPANRLEFGSSAVLPIHFQLGSHNPKRSTPE
jgi:protein TonB